MSPVPTAVASFDPAAPPLSPEAPPPLPAPGLDDPFAIGEALYDPAQVEQGMVSLIDRLGIDTNDLQLEEPEIRGLIAMGVADLKADPDGSLPYTFADLHAGVAPFLPGVTAQDLAGQYQAAYERDPDALVPQVMLGQPIEVDTQLTRVHLWLLFADGFVIAPGAKTASLGTPAEIGRRWGTARHVTTPLTAPPGMDPSDLATILFRLRTVGFMLGLGVHTSTLTAHEGHNGPGAPMSVVAGVLGGQPVPRALQPYIRMGRQLPFDLTIRSTDPGVWRSHGSMTLEFDRPQRAAGSVAGAFRPKREDADGRGEEVWEIADIRATARAADLLATYLDLPFAPAVLDAIAPGDIASPTREVLLAWHTDEGIFLELTNDFDVDLGLRPVIVIGDAKAKGWDKVIGFLPRRDDGIYRGTLLSIGEVTVDCQFGGAQIHETIQGRQSLDVFVEVRSGGRHPPAQDVVRDGTFGPDDAHISFYPAGAAIDSDGLCIQPVWSPGGGPLDRSGLTYRWFNDSRWTDPSLGYTIGLPPANESLWYEDQRLSKQALSGPGGISGVDSVWTVRVQKVGH